MGKRRYDSKKVSKSLGLTVRSIRATKDWTLEECESHGWTNWRTLQEIESGKGNITIQTIVNLSNLFNVHPGIFFEDI